MAGLVPAIYVLRPLQYEDVDARDKRGHYVVENHGNSATCSSPEVSGKPSMRFMFCTA